jgi:hypothetical protein
MPLSPSHDVLHCIRRLRRNDTEGALAANAVYGVATTFTVSKL